MTEEQWTRKYEDTHAGLSIAEKLGSCGSLIKSDPSDKNARHVKRYKSGIESAEAAKRKDAFQQFMLDTVSVRADDMMDKKQLPMKDLLKVVVSSLPKQIEVEANVTNSVVDIWNTIEAAGRAVSLDDVEDADVVE